jgi:hypothetical protein
MYLPFPAPFSAAWGFALIYFAGGGWVEGLLANGVHHGWIGCYITIFVYHWLLRCEDVCMWDSGWLARVWISAEVEVCWQRCSIFFVASNTCIRTYRNCDNRIVFLIWFWHHSLPWSTPCFQNKKIRSYILYPIHFFEVGVWLCTSTHGQFCMQFQQSEMIPETRVQDL